MAEDVDASEGPEAVPSMVRTSALRELPATPRGLQVASIDPEFRKLGQRRAEAVIRRNARGTEGLQQDAKHDEVVTTFDDLVYAATRLWVNALRIAR